MTELKQYKPQIQDVRIVAREVKIPPKLYSQITNIGFTTVDIDYSGGIAVAGGFQTHRLPPGDGISLPPTGLEKFSAIALVANGKLLILGDTAPIPTQARRNDQTGRIVRGFDVTSVNDADTLVYNIAADFIVAAGGSRVRAILLICETNAAFVRFDAVTTAVTEPEAFLMEVGDVFTIDNLELIEGIHARTVAAGQNWDIRGMAIGD